MPRIMTRAELRREMKMTDVELNQLLEEIDTAAANVGRRNPIRVVGEAGDDQMLTLDDAFAQLWAEIRKDNP